MILMNGFKNFRKFLTDLQKALEGEVGAINFYTQLLTMTSNQKYREYIEDARNDERRHFELFSNLYVNLTGYRPMVPEPTPFTGTFCQGVQKAFDDELEAYILYRDMMLNTSIMEIRDIIFIPFSDENEHAQKFNWIISDLKAKGEC